MTNYKYIFLLMMACMVISWLGFAQTAQPGFPPFSSQASGGIDSINLYNLNVNIGIPLLTRAGRGLPFKAELFYNSSMYGQEPTVASCTGSGSLCWTIAQYNGWSNLYFPAGPGSDGTSHPFPGGGGYATDQSGYYQICNFFCLVSIDRDGTQYAQSISDQIPTITDRNGNILSGSTTVNGNTITYSYVDTLGVTAFTTNINTTSTSQSVTYSYPVFGTTTPASVSVNFSGPQPMHTAFNCPNVNESWTSNKGFLLSSVVMPDGSKYLFDYEFISGSPGFYTGRIKTVTLPTGGTITYAYTGSNDGINCSDGTTMSLTRTTPDGQWTYTRSVSGATSTTTVQDPLGNQLVVTFLNGFEVSRKTYQLIVGSLNLLQTTATCYNGNCSPSSITNPITQITQYLQLPGGKQNRRDTFLDATSGLQTELDEYDFGMNQPGALLRKTLTVYANLGGFGNALDRPHSVTVCTASGSDPDCNGAGPSGGTKVAQTTFGLDEKAPAATSGVTQHSAPLNARGNITSMHQWLNTSGATLDTSIVYDDTGNIIAVTDPGGHQTVFSYSCNNAFLSQISYPDTYSPSLAHHEMSAGYDCNSALVSNTTDQNGNTASYAYDNMFRLSETDYPDGGVTTSTFFGPTSTTIQRKIDGTRLTSFNQLTDSLGRLSRIAIGNDEGGFDQQDICYDSDGRIAFKSYPYQGSGWQTPQVCSGAGDSFTHDALGRLTQVTHSDGTIATTTYSGQASQITDEGNGSSNVTRILQKDGLGNLAYVCEVYGGAALLGGGGTPASCGLDIPGSGFLTSYTHDLLGNLTSVSQGTLGIRSYSFDSLSRMISETTPEAGRVTYNYNADSVLTSRTRPAPNQTDGTKTYTTNYAYDALHRLTDRTYITSDPVNAPMNTPGAHFAYDAIPSWGNPSVITSNGLGRLTEAYTDSPIAGSVFGYDQMGRLTMNNQCTPLDCANTRIQITGGTSTLKYVFNAACLSTNGATYTDSIWVKNQGTVPVQIGGQIAEGPVIQPGTAQQVSFSYTGNGVLCSQLRLETLNPSDSIDVIANNPSVTVNGGANLIPAGNQNFTGWGTFSGSSVTLTQNGTRPADRPVNYAYDLAGDMISSTNGVGVVFNYSYNIAQRLTGITSSLIDAQHPGTLLSNAHYSPALITDTLGNGLAESIGFTPRGLLQSESIGQTFGQPATQATGSVTINGTEQSRTTTTTTCGAPFTIDGGCTERTITKTVYDSGTVTITVNGHPDSASFGQNDTPTTIAGNLVTAINGDGGSPVTANISGSNGCPGSGNVVCLASKITGTAGNYSLSASVSESLGSFNAAASGSSLTGGQDAVNGSNPIYSYSLVHAPDGQITSANDFVNGNWNFAYDSMNRLATSNKNFGQQTFSYVFDRYGNRWQQNAPQGGPSATYTFDNNNHIQSGIGGLSFDGLGNVTYDGFHYYTFDAENRMIQVDGGTTASYAYDALGRRAEGPNGDYIYDQDGNMITQLGLNGVWNYTEIYAAGRHIATYSGGTTNFMHSDWLGTKRVMTGVGGGPTETCTGFSFGDGLSCTGAMWNFNQFTDDIHDLESNLEHTLFRQYSSAQGRWLSPDPAGTASADPGNPQSWNRYTYVLGNPANAIDTTGLDPCTNGYGAFLCGPGLFGDFSLDESLLPWGVWGDLSNLSLTPGMGFQGCGTTLLPGNPCLPFKTVSDQLSDLLAGLPWNSPCAMSPISDGCGLDHFNAIPPGVPPYSWGDLGRAGATAGQTVLDSLKTLIESMGGIVHNLPCWLSHGPCDDIKMRMFGGRWCGPGGAGDPTNAVDKACQVHDTCYDNNGLTIRDNFRDLGSRGSIMQACNQALCDAVGTGTSAGRQISLYFSSVGKYTCH